MRFLSGSFARCGVCLTDLKLYLISMDVFIRYALPYLASTSHGAPECEIERGFIELCISNYFSHSGA